MNENLVLKSAEFRTPIESEIQMYKQLFDLKLCDIILSVADIDNKYHLVRYRDCSDLYDCLNKRFFKDPRHRESELSVDDNYICVDSNNQRSDFVGSNENLGSRFVFKSGNDLIMISEDASYLTLDGSDRNLIDYLYKNLLLKNSKTASLTSEAFNFLFTSVKDLVVLKKEVDSSCGYVDKYFLKDIDSLTRAFSLLEDNERLDMFCEYWVEGDISSSLNDIIEIKKSGIDAYIESFDKSESEKYLLSRLKTLRRELGLPLFDTVSKYKKFQKVEKATNSRSNGKKR